MANDYVYNSTYAFSENKLGMGIELEGLEILPFDIIWAVMKYGGQSSVDKMKSGLNKFVDAGNPALTVSRAVNNPNFDPEKDRIQRMSQAAQGFAEFGKGASETGHFALDIIGIADPTGLADGVNSLWYAAEAICIRRVNSTWYFAIYWRCI